VGNLFVSGGKEHSVAVSGTRRRLLLVSTNYAPEHAGIGPYATQIAEHWAAGGAEVHVLAGMPHYPAWRLDPAYAGVWRTEEERGGVRVHRRRHLVPPRQTAVRRALFEASLLGYGTVAPPAMDRPDAVVAQMPSLAGGILGARLAAKHKVPYVPVVQDLMGAAAAQSGIRGGGRAAAVAGAAEAYALKRATLVGVIHETFVAKVAAMGVPEERIRLVPNWSHVSRPSRPRAEMRARLGWRPGQVVLLHSGNMGLKQGLEVLVEAARTDPEVRVVLMGEGNQREALRSLAGNLPNLDFLPPAEDEDFPEVLAAADVLVVTQRASVLDMSIPSKLTSYLAAGRPVVASVAAEGGTAQEVERSGAGVLVPPEDPRALLDAVRALADDPDRADALGARGPEYVDARLSRAAGLARIDALLAEALGEPQAPPIPQSPPVPAAPPVPQAPPVPAAPPVPQAPPEVPDQPAETAETPETAEAPETARSAGEPETAEVPDEPDTAETPEPAGAPDEALGETEGAVGK
jgi:colanic acid biosynthesis glycosyl transferase WcaI